MVRRLTTINQRAKPSHSTNRAMSKPDIVATVIPESHSKKRVISTRKPVSKIAKLAIKTALSHSPIKPKKTATSTTKKLFRKTGQRYATPMKTDPLCRFYMTLLKQRPDSKMALKWCIEHGTLSEKMAVEGTLAIEMQEKAKIVDSLPLSKKVVIQK